MRHFTLSPTVGLRCRPHWSVHPLDGYITLDGRTDMILPGRSALVGNPGYWLLLGKPWCHTMPHKLHPQGFKLDVSLHGVTVVIPTNDREFPGSTPGKYNLQIKITSRWSVPLPGRTRVVVRRGPGIGSHIGRRVRDGHLKGPGPNQT